MSTTRLINTIHVELYAAEDGVGDWRDVSHRAQAGAEDVGCIHIENADRGGADEIPATASMTLRMLDTDGWLTPWNPAGPWFDSLDQNCPIRVNLLLSRDTFNRTVASGLGSTPGVGDWDALAYTNTGNGSSSAADFNVTPGVATHSVGAVLNYRQSILTGVSAVDTEQRIGFRLPVSDVTGAGIEPANLICRATADGYVLLRCVVAADESVTLRFLWITAGGATTNLTAEVTTGVVNSGQWIWVASSVEGVQYRAKAWAMGDPEPLEWAVNASYDSEAVFVVAPGGVGWRTGVGFGNTNAKPVVVSYMDYRVRSPRFTGWTSAIAPQPVDPTGSVIVTDITAAGALHQILAGQTALDSTLRRSIPLQPGLVAYWPMEDGSDSERFASAFPGFPGMEVLEGSPSYAGFNGFPASKPLPYLSHSVWAGEVPNYTFAGVIQFRFFMQLPVAGSVDTKIISRFYTEQPGAWFWELRYRTGGDLELAVMTTETTQVYTTGQLDTNLDGKLARVSVELVQNGANVDWKCYAYVVGSTSSTAVYFGTMAGISMKAVPRIFFNNSWYAVADRLDQAVIGHVTLQSQITSVFDVLAEQNAYVGETTYARWARLGRERGYATCLQPGRDAHLRMGPQRVGTLEDNLREVQRVGNAFVWEARGDVALCYREVTSVYAKVFEVPAVYGQLVMPYQPVVDDTYLRNRWTITRTEGSSVVVEQTTGRRSTAAPGKGGVGEYGSELELNPDGDALLDQQGGLRLSTGTVVEPRYPAMRIERARPDVLADPVLRARLLDARPGDRVVVGGATTPHQYDPIRQVIAGWTEDLGLLVHTFSFVTRPYSPYDGFTVESVEYGRLDSRASTVNQALDDSATALVVGSTGAWWTVDPAQWPVPVMIKGELLTATAISDPTPVVVATGTAAHADNASVTPGLPGGTTGAGDVLLLPAVSRNTSARPQAPAGYSTLWDGGHFRLFGKYHTGAEVAPTVTVTGGGSGDTLTAQMASVRGVALDVLAVSDQVNTSAQNVAFAAVYAHVYKALGLYLGWKADDATSVDTVTGATEVGEASTTVGGDQTLMWDYKAVTSPVGLINGSFVVNGGAGAVSRGVTLLFMVPQVFTVTRGVNGFSKAHRVGDQVHIFRQNHWAL